LGWTILEQNVYTPYGEIDIIASKDDVLWVVEVKGSSSLEISYERVTKAKQKRVSASIEHWLMDQEICYEEISFVVCFRTTEGLDWIVDAFDA